MKNIFTYLNTMVFNVVLCAIIKDELDLEEWVAYNLLIGFEHIYIYDDQSQIPISTRLENIKDQVTVIDYDYQGPLETRGKQTEAYNTCLQNHGKETEYMAFLDGDEFLVLKQHQNVYDFIKDMNVDGIAINSLFFDSNGHITRPEGLVIENYVHAKPFNYIKSIVKTSKVIQVGIHNASFELGSKYIGMTNRPVLNHCQRVRENTYDIAQLNHYQAKSMEDWGRRLVRKQVNNATRPIEFFYIEGTLTDTTILEQGWPDKIKEFLSLHNISNQQILQTKTTLPKDFEWKTYLELLGDDNIQYSEEYALSHRMTHS